MARKAFRMMMDGMEDAIAVAEGDTGRGRLAGGVEVKTIRLATGKTQAQFASAFHLPVGTIRDWEQNRRRPDAPARVLLALIKADPDAVTRMLQSQP